MLLPQSHPATGVVVESLSEDFPVPFQVFQALLRDTPDRVWLGIIRRNHGMEKHTERAWYALIDQYRDQRG